VLSVNLTGLAPVTSYTLQVRARDAATNLGPATSASFTTPADNVAPSVPTALSGTAPNQTTVNLTWNASSDNIAVTGYRIYRNGGQIGTSATTSYSDGGRAGFTTYSYQVAAYDAATNVSVLTTAIDVKTPDQTAPSIPTSLSATAVGASQINLSWGASTDSGGSGLAGYRVYRGGSLIASTTSTSYSNTGLTGSTAYSYTVAAYDNATPGNTSAQSNTASATTSAALTASLSTGSWRWLKRGSNATQIDPPVVCTASGGSGTGYTYAWLWISGDTQTSAISATSSSTRWSRTVPNSDATYSSLWRCLVTDSTGNTAQNTVSVTFIRTTIQ
jgi:chitodextrinase